MIYDRFYYTVLSDKEKAIYKKFYYGMEKLDKSISFPFVTCKDMDFTKIIKYVLLDNPHLFYVDNTCYSFIETPLETSVRINYLYTKQEVSELKDKINVTISNMLKQIRGSNEYEIEKSVHDLILANVSYDQIAVHNIKKYQSRANTILGVLFYKTAVCEGISATIKLLLNIYDIKCIVAIGMSLRENEPHAWNVVKINGENYHLDATWDLPQNGSCIRYDYFNLTDSDIKKDHYTDERYPLCRSYTHNYFVKNNLVVKKDIDLVRIATLRGISDSVNFKYLGNDSLQTAANKFCTVARFEGFCSANEEQGTVLVCRRNKPCDY